jgi:hypothetical protein
MEEMCRETAKARAIFDRWMAFEPDHAAWMAYIKVRNSHPPLVLAAQLDRRADLSGLQGSQWFPAHHLMVYGQQPLSSPQFVWYSACRAASAWV